MGHVERIQSKIKIVLSKLCGSAESKWYKYGPKLKRFINSTKTLNINYGHFEVITKIKMNSSDMQDMKIILEEKYSECIMDKSEDMRDETKKKYSKVPKEKKVQFDEKRIQ